MKRLICAMLLLCRIHHGEAQEQEAGSGWEQLVEEAARSGEAEEMDGADWYEVFQDLLKNPIPLNTAGKEELAAIPFLSDWHIEQFLSYRKLMGPLLSCYELQAVPGWGTELIRKLMPLVKLGGDTDIGWARRWKEGERRLSAALSGTFQKAKGFLPAGNSEPVYRGSAKKWQARFRYQFGQSLQWGGVLEKDAGEVFMNRGRLNGFAGFYLQMKGWKGITQLNAGDFSVSMGQGLLQWQGMGNGPGGNASAIYRQAPLVKAHTSAGEDGFYRGVATMLNRKSWSLSLYTGLRRLGARADSVTDGPQQVSAINFQGLYRTATEMERRGRFRMWGYGGAVSWKKGALRLGLNAAGVGLNEKIKVPDEPYALFRNGDSRQLASSLTVAYTGAAAYVFGEYALDGRWNPAFLGGVMMVPHPKCEWVFLVRKIPEKYQVWNGNVFANTASPSNEYGCYSGLKYLFSGKLEVNIWMDVYRNPWLRYRISAPGWGKAFQCQLSGKPDRVTEWRWVLRMSEKMEDKALQESLLRTPVKVRTAGMGCYFSVMPPGEWQFRSRLDIVLANREGEPQRNGALWWGEARWIPSRTGITIDGRVQYFQTDDYATRIYASERDIPFRQVVPAWYGKGWYIYGMVRYKIGKWLHCWMKLAQARKPGVESLGSGYNAVTGSGRTELSVQWQVLF